MAAPALESVPHLERNATNSFYDSDKYDTDLEDVDLEIKTVAPVVEENSIGANIYRSECRKRQLIPMTAILKYLNKDIMKLRHRAMGIEAAEALAAALEINTTIVHLDLEGNKLEAPGALVMSQVLVYNQFITHVNLAKNNMGAAHPTIRASVPLSEVMKRNMEIKHLNLSDNNFTEEDAKYFALGIEGNDQITELDLSNNHFQEKGAQYIGKALGENRSIERLNLSWNHIRRRGAVSICRALQKNKTLVYLDLSWNGLGYEGSLALGQVLKRNRWLKELNISNNRISHRAAEFIANGLRRNSTLEVLKIGMNPLTTNGAQNIIESVSCTCSAIKELDMSGVPVLGEFEFMAGAIQQSRQFKYTHGGTVSNHDAIGRKPNAAVDPMRKVIAHMQSMNLRPLELFRSMDKEKMYNMNKESFRQRLKNADMGLYKGDLEEVLALVSESKQGGVNAAELSRGMKNQVRKEKLEQIRVKQQEKKVERIP
ncbi:leucine-rich repeat-containing protein 74B [Lingula anatina]|uniref:Leucine-rich repeat-containing protein 74B n=1 Tax=Lingula anatina TaxID=7574 RepID=A0A1S3HDT2_LINAN|nr:leucine-rich repeat-containing protein 74B [Lingula anatina]|eukprot:XP_013383646.1 leucine-rich repeat-containing protein 74B [Lingula anatina]